MGVEGRRSQKSGDRSQETEFSVRLKEGVRRQERDGKEVPGRKGEVQSTKAEVRKRRSRKCKKVGR